MSKQRGKGATSPHSKSKLQAFVRKASDQKLSLPLRVAAVHRLAAGMTQEAGIVKAVLEILRDAETPVPVRLAALEAIQAASFAVVRFNPFRTAYITALRSIAADPDPEIRQRVLGFLSREKDGFAQKRLLDGLNHPEKALVNPEKALQLLSNDIHVEAYSAARKIVRQPPNSEAKIEALRLLSADTRSVSMFEELLRDKKESEEVRLLSAAALHSLAPAKLLSHAREMVLDDKESNELKASSLTALAHFGDEAALSKDVPLRKHIARLKGESGAPGVQKSARQFLSRYQP